jgi:hypothetical protein
MTQFSARLMVMAPLVATITELEATPAILISPRSGDAAA